MPDTPLDIRRKMHRDINQKYWTLFKREVILAVSLIFIGALFIAAKYGAGAFWPGLKMTLLAGIAIYVPRAVCLPRLAALDKEKEAEKIKHGISVYNELMYPEEIQTLENEKIIRYEQTLGKILLGPKFARSKADEKVKKR